MKTSKNWKSTEALLCLQTQAASIALTGKFIFTVLVAKIFVQIPQHGWHLPGKASGIFKPGKAGFRVQGPWVNRSQPVLLPMQPHHLREQVVWLSARPASSPGDAVPISYTDVSWVVYEMLNPLYAEPTSE